MDETRHQEITLYIYNEEGEGACRFLPAKTGEPIRTLRKGLPFGFYLLESANGEKMLYSDDVIIPLDRGWSPDLAMRGGEPCVIDSEGRAHYFVKTFDEFKKELLEETDKHYKRRFRYSSYKFSYKEITGPDGEKHQTDIMISHPIGRPGNIREICDANNLYDTYQYGVPWETLLDVMEQENKQSFIAPMQYMTDPKALWNVYKEMIIPEFVRGYAPADLATVSEFKECFIRFRVENRTDPTEETDFALTMDHLEKMNVDVDTVYAQSIKNLESRSNEIDPPFEYEPWSSELDDYPGWTQTPSEARKYTSSGYQRSAVLLPAAQEQIKIVYPEGYQISVTDWGQVVVYPKHVIHDQKYIDDLREKMDRKRDEYEAKMRAEEERKRQSEEEKKPTPKRGIFDGLFQKGKAKTAIF